MRNDAQEKSAPVYSIILTCCFDITVAFRTMKRELNLLFIAGLGLLLPHSCSVDSKQNKTRFKKEIRLALLYPFPPKKIILADKLELLPFIGAYDLAKEAVSIDLLPGITLPLIWNDTKWSSSNALRAITDQWRDKADAFIGPGNYQGYCNTSARLAAAWNLPMVSYVSWLTTS